MLFKNSHRVHSCTIWVNFIVWLSSGTVEPWILVFFWQTWITCEYPTEVAREGADYTLDARNCS